MLFVIPSIFVMLWLSYLAVVHMDIPAMAAAFYGVQPVVVAVVIEAVLRIGKKALKHFLLYVFAAMAFTAIFFFKIAFPYIIGIAALGGLRMQRWLPKVFCKLPLQELRQRLWAWCSTLGSGSVTRWFCPMAMALTRLSWYRLSSPCYYYKSIIFPSSTDVCQASCRLYRKISSWVPTGNWSPFSPMRRFCYCDAIFNIFMPLSSSFRKFF